MWAAGAAWLAALTSPAVCVNAARLQFDGRTLTLILQ
jgi:hypothetical protein